MANPAYTDLQKEEIPTVIEAHNKVIVHVVSGSWHEHEGAYQSISDVHLALIEMKTGGILNTAIACNRNIFFYMVKGRAVVNGEQVEKLNLVEFIVDHGQDINITASEDTIILLGHALPNNEPVVSKGSFVMNTDEEIRQAYADYWAGKMGAWKE